MEKKPQIEQQCIKREQYNKKDFGLSLRCMYLFCTLTLFDQNYQHFAQTSYNNIKHVAVLPVPMDKYCINYRIGWSKASWQLGWTPFFLSLLFLLDQVSTHTHILSLLNQFSICGCSHSMQAILNGIITHLRKSLMVSWQSNFSNQPSFLLNQLFINPALWYTYKLNTQFS